MEMTPAPLTIPQSNTVHMVNLGQTSSKMKQISGSKPKMAGSEISSAVYETSGLGDPENNMKVVQGTSSEGGDMQVMPGSRIVFRPRVTAEYTDLDKLPPVKF